MATSTDLEQTGRDANIINYLLGEPVDLLPADNYGRLGQLLLQLVDIINQIKGTMFHYAGRVDTVEDLEEITGNPNDIYFVGPEDSASWDEYIWATDDASTGEGHWDRLGGVTIIIDDHLDAQSTNPVQNAVITLALADKTNLTVIGPSFSDQTQYSLGNLVVKDGVLYKYTSDTASTGAWDLTKWTATTIADILADKLDSSTAASTYLTIANAAVTYLTITDAATTYATKSEIPDISGKAEASALAAPYDPTAVYTDGDRMTLNGELYICDSTAGQYIPVGENLLVTYASRLKDSTYGCVDERYWESYGTPGSSVINSGMYISGIIPIKQNTNYKIYEAGWYSVAARYYALAMFTNGASFNTIARAFQYGYNGASATGTFDSGSYQYISLSMPKDNTQAAQYSLYELSAYKFRKVTVDSELNTKANTSDLATVATSGDYSDLNNTPTIPDAVTVTQTGDVYVGTVCVRKVLTQAEYDLLDPPDERCDYKIVPATT